MGTALIVELLAGPRMQHLAIRCGLARVNAATNNTAAYAVAAQRCLRAALGASTIGVGRFQRLLSTDTTGCGGGGTAPVRRAKPIMRANRPLPLTLQTRLTSSLMMIARAFHAASAAAAAPRKPKSEAAGAASAAVADASDDSTRPPAPGSVEDIYQKKSQREHILLRPEPYIGSVAVRTAPNWILKGGKIVGAEVSFVPGLYQIFDEILVNAADNVRRQHQLSSTAGSGGGAPAMTAIRIDIDPTHNRMSVWNDGPAIPIDLHKKEKVHVPELIFGHLLTSSNFDDTQKRFTGSYRTQPPRMLYVLSDCMYVVG